MCDNFEKILPGSGWQSRAGWVLTIAEFLKNLTVGADDIGQIVTAVEHTVHLRYGGGIKIGQIQAGQVITQTEHPKHIRHVGCIKVTEIQSGQAVAAGEHESHVRYFGGIKAG